MALHADLEALLSHMEAADAEAQRKIFEKNPQLAEGYLRQADYDRFMNKAKSDITTANEKSKKWEDWAKVNVPRHESLLKDYESVKTRNSELEKAVKDAANKAGGGDMTEAERIALETKIVEEIGKRGYVTQSDIDKIAADKAKESAVAAVKTVADDFFTKTWPSALEVQQQMIEINFDHAQEFGKPLRKEDRIKIAELMKENNITDVKEAYDKFVAADREKKRVDDEVAKRLEEEKKKRGDNSLPGVTDAGLEAGHMQMRFSKRAESGAKLELPAEYEIGDNTAASAAAAELRAEGKV